MIIINSADSFVENTARILDGRALQSHDSTLKGILTHVDGSAQSASFKPNLVQRL
jgi:hypothetical protein